MTEAATFRREPTQARAKARVERILAAASELIAETGSDAVRMSEIAERAGVPIGSLYQYFPDKAAMLRTLALRFMDRVREGLRVGLGGIETGEEALTRVDDILRGYYEVFITEPVVRDIWSGTQSDKELQALDVEDSRENGRIFFEALKHLVPKRELARLETGCFLLMQLSGAAVRLAIAVDRKEGDRLMVEYRGMIRREMERFLFPA
jgi:AcrR family transcriptional regulator